MLTMVPGQFYYAVTCARTGCGEPMAVRHVDLREFQPADDPESRYDLTCPKCGVRTIYRAKEAVMTQATGSSRTARGRQK